MSLKILIGPILNVNRKEAGQFNAICGGERCHSSALLPQKCTFVLLCKNETFCNCRLSFQNDQDRFGILSHHCLKFCVFTYFGLADLVDWGLGGDCRIGSIGLSVHGERITPQPPKPVHRCTLHTTYCMLHTTQCAMHIPAAQASALHTACCIPHMHSNANYKLYTYILIYYLLPSAYHPMHTPTGPNQYTAQGFTLQTLHFTLHAMQT